MNLEPGHVFYHFDPGLDDSHSWECSHFTCRHCLFEFLAIHREDQPTPECPRCVDSGRWVKVSAFEQGS